MHDATTWALWLDTDGEIHLRERHGRILIDGTKHLAHFIETCGPAGPGQYAKDETGVYRLTAPTPAEEFEAHQRQEQGGTVEPEGGGPRIEAG